MCRLTILTAVPSPCAPVRPVSLALSSYISVVMERSRPPRKEDPHKEHPLYWKNVEGGLFEHEFFWRDHQRWLADAGYILRPRFREDWQPSWLKSKKLFFQCEDGQTTVVSFVPYSIHVQLSPQSHHGSVPLLWTQFAYWMVA